MTDDTEDRLNYYRREIERHQYVLTMMRRDREAEAAQCWRIVGWAGRESAKAGSDAEALANIVAELEELEFIDAQGELCAFDGKIEATKNKPWNAPSSEAEPYCAPERGG